MDEDEIERRELVSKIVEVGTGMDTFAERLAKLEAFANKASDDLTFVMNSMIEISTALADVINRVDNLEDNDDEVEDKNGH